MKKLFYLTSLIAVIVLSSALLSWDPHCDHVYTTVVQPEVKIERTSTVISVYQVMTGKHERDELICVKCFHRRKQVVDYGCYDQGIINIDHRICPANSAGPRSMQCDTLIK